MQRRGFFAAIAAAVVGLATLARSSSVFASTVRQSATRVNGNGVPHSERGGVVTLHYTDLEDTERFHQYAEHLRLTMIQSLAGAGAPINVWRNGTMSGGVASAIDARTGEPCAWRDEHILRLRTRCSTETPPFTHPLT